MPGVSKFKKFTLMLGKNPLALNKNTQSLGDNYLIIINP